MMEFPLPAALTLTDPQRPWLGAKARRLWGIEPEWAFLNHGSFGATPRVVLEAQREWQDRMERQLVRFFIKELPGLLRGTADRLGPMLGTVGANIAFVDNATSGVNAVLRSLAFAEGDEIVYTSHGYGAVNKAVQYACGRAGAKAVEVRMPFPIHGPEAVLECVAGALTARTKLAVIDHITSASALVLPLRELVELCHERGVPVLADGAHGPGQVPVALDELGAEFYTGNAHKWLFAPKGTAFLYVRPDLQSQVHPLTISWGWPEGFLREFDWPGTRDWSGVLALNAALDFYHRVPVARRQEWNNGLAAWAAGMLEKSWGVAPGAPSAMRAAMATIRLPQEVQRRCGNDVTAKKALAERIHDALAEQHQIEVPVHEFQGNLYLRISAQAYNVPEDYLRLRDALPAVLRSME